MSDEKTYTEREVIMRERAAYICGVQRLHIQADVPSGSIVGRAVERAEALAGRLYPLPKVQRQRARVVTDRNGDDWSFQLAVDAPREALLMWRRAGTVYWRNASAKGYPSITADLAADLAPLFANPTETVLEDADV